jgi:hypothetical protein
VKGINEDKEDSKNKKQKKTKKQKSRTMVSGVLLRPMYFLKKKKKLF